MDATLILVKTSKGIEEVKSRAFGLAQHLRMMLIMVDGSTSLSSLLNRTAQLPRAREDIDWLVREGFVESMPAGAKRPAPAGTPPTSAMPPREMLVVMTRDLLGPDASKVIQRLQEAGESVEELGAALERCHKLIKLTIDENKAQQFLKASQSLLAEFK